MSPGDVERLVAAQRSSSASPAGRAVTRYA
jgi:hypothetical protein